jgi:predicted short-subunit dehydrogenase-like oxidoreductase (DUF2520 family)
MIKVVLLGGGNVGFHLANIFLNTKTVKLVQVYNRSINNIKHLENKTQITTDLNNIAKADLYIISVSDSAVATLANQLQRKNALIVHTSGSVNMNVLDSHKNHGVFYPLQTFSKSRSPDFSNIPLCLEANTKQNLNVLEQLAKSINCPVYYINSTQREYLHTAAIFVNNFVNHLYYISNQISEQHQVNPDILHALIKETTEKAIQITPYKAQTGPARRGDSNTINKHLNKLSGNNKAIYKLLSESIATTYEQEL